MTEWREKGAYEENDCLLNKKTENCILSDQYLDLKTGERERKRERGEKRERATKGKKHFPLQEFFLFKQIPKGDGGFIFFSSFFFFCLFCFCCLVIMVVAFVQSTLFLNRFKLERIFSQIQINRHAGGVPGPWEPKGEAVRVLESIQWSRLLCCLPTTTALVAVC